MDSTTTPIGLDGIVRLVRELIEVHLHLPMRPEAWVVGVFGEWGSGKSTLLAEIARSYPNQPIARSYPNQLTDDAYVTLRIDFNAWRFEREEHLLVPLLRTIERTLEDYLAALERPPAEPPQANPPVGMAEAAALGVAVVSPPAKPPSSWKERAIWLADRAQLVGQCAIAMTQMVRVKAGLPGFGEVELAFQRAKEAAEPPAAKPPAVQAKQRAESLYYNLFHELKRLTRGDGPKAPRLNFVFLIDDLDRCLPEKAVEMLESIKLFLDVEGCVFVLAVDDEVVERGIAHRYRDYLDITDRAAESIAHSLKPDRYRDYLNRYTNNRQPPITGAEYLEKIVQLPIRLPRFSRQQATDLLHRQEPAMFAPSEAAPGLQPTEWLLDLFLDAVPPVPRKLIRAIDLLVFVRLLASRQGSLKRLQAYTLAQLVLLQLFAPQMFRYLARRDRMESWTRLDARMQAARGKRGLDIYGQSFFKWWEDVVASDRKAAEDREASGTGTGVTLTELERYEEPFVTELRQACTTRSGFDPRKLFLPSLTVDRNLRPYFNLLAEDATVDVAASVAATPSVTNVVAGNVVATGDVTVVHVVAPPPPAIEPASPPAAVTPAPPATARTPVAPLPRSQEEPQAAPMSAAPRELENFIDLLLSPHRDSWHGALNSEPGLQGRVLDRQSFVSLRDRIAQQQFSVTAAWLDIVGAILTDLQVKELLLSSGVVTRLATSVSPFDTFALGALLESACKRLQPWHSTNTERLQGADIGLAEGVDLRRRDWAYRYRRGLIFDEVTPNEHPDLWRGQGRTVSVPVHAVREITPGVVATSTERGDIRLWSRAFRGEWMIHSRIGLASPEPFNVAPLSPFHLVGWSTTQIFGYRKGTFGRWNTVYRNFLSEPISELTVLGPDAFVHRRGQDGFSVWVREGEQNWIRIDGPRVVAIGGFAALGPRRFMVVAESAHLCEVDEKRVVMPTPAWSNDFKPRSAVGLSPNVAVVMVSSSELQLIRVQGTDSRVIAKATSEIHLGRLLPMSGDKLLVANADGAFEVWVAGESSLEKLGHGAVGLETQLARPFAERLCVLRDGRVLHASITAVAVLAPTAAGGRYEIEGLLAELYPKVPPAAALGNAVTVGHRAGAVSLDLGPHQETKRPGPTIRSVSQAERTAFLDACHIGPDEVAFVDGGAAVYVANRTTGVMRAVSLDMRAATFVTSAGGRLYVGGASSVHELVREQGDWSTGRAFSFELPQAAQGIAAADDGCVVAWQGAQLAVSQPGTTAVTYTNLSQDLPITSVAALPSDWDLAPATSGFLVCGGGQVYVLTTAPHIQMTTWSGAFGHIALAAGLSGRRTLALTAEGSLQLFEGTQMTRVSEDVLHGWPLRLCRVDDNGVLVYALDDAWYRIDAPANHGLSVTRLLVADDALLAQDITLVLEDIFGTGIARTTLLPLDPALRQRGLRLPWRAESREPGPTNFVPTSDSVRQLVALLRTSGELAEPSALPKTIDWEVAGIPVQATALRVHGSPRLE